MHEPRVRVVHLLGPLRPSGMERMLVSAAPHFAELGIASYVYGLREGSVFDSKLEDAGLQVFLGARPSASLSAARNLRRIVRSHDINVVHIHTEADYLRTAAIARQAVGTHGCVVRTVHGNFLATGRWRISRKIQARLASLLVHSTIAPSPDVAKNEWATIGRKCRVVYNWVDDRVFAIRDMRTSGSTPHPRTALILGNCAQVKGHEIALRALLDTDWSLMHLGDEGRASNTERTLLDRLDEQGRLIRRGAQDPDKSLYEAAVLLMPSRREGMGVALAEGLVAGIPALVSDAPGLGWARQFPGVTYLPDTPDAWRNALMALDESLVDSALDALPVDLSARRGANEYAAIYREGLRRQTQSAS